MSLLKIIRSAVSIADKVTKSLHPEVVYERYLSDDGYGTSVFASPVGLRAIVDLTTKQVPTREGVLIPITAIIDLLDVAAVAAATSGAGIGNKDRFTLPNGSTGPTVKIDGFVDAGTGQPVATRVMLG